MILKPKRIHGARVATTNVRLPYGRHCRNDARAFYGRRRGFFDAYFSCYLWKRRCAPSPWTPRDLTFIIMLCAPEIRINSPSVARFYPAADRKPEVDVIADASRNRFLPTRRTARPNKNTAVENVNLKFQNLLFLIVQLYSRVTDDQLCVFLKQ